MLVCSKTPVALITWTKDGCRRLPSCNSTVSKRQSICCFRKSSPLELQEISLRKPAKTARNSCTTSGLEYCSESLSKLASFKS